MKTLQELVLPVLVLLLFAELAMSLVSDAQWTQYKAQYMKRYRREIDDKYHRALFSNSVQAVAHNNRLYSQGRVGFRMRLNQFSDVDPSQLSKFRTSVPPPPESGTRIVTKPPGYKSYNQITGGIDWRKFGLVSEVGDQGTQCFSCWAFSTTGVLEAHLAKKNKRMVPLSPKHLVDCVPLPSLGCLGGWVGLAFNYTRDNGIATKASYPYKPEKDDCNWNSKNSAGTLRGYVTLDKDDEKELAEVVYNIGPVTASIDHLHDEFNQYSGGVLRIPACRSDKGNLYHSVLIVGFGTDPKWGEYWLIKNSYGTTWGENGFFRLARNANNMCGVATYVQYPLL
ncbi:procathepsin L-like [Drosophila eugracilis]|uniref:procathepsin L-like n=1 Tax=Drosophila eugracilis TaxID=29029 RepID=UPI001BD9B0B3|nr:procathepsin L-like [Drosophila eugracilis]